MFGKAIMLDQSSCFPEKRILKFLFNSRRENHRKSQEEHIQKIFDIIRKHLTNIKNNEAEIFSRTPFCKKILLNRNRNDDQEEV